jgi:hypothetical protein
MRLFLPRLYCFLWFALSLSSCAVYAPMQPAAPQLRDKGQLELQATSFLTGRWEVAANYSPLRYTLVRAAGGWRTDTGDSLNSRLRQYEVGAGGYWPITSRWLLTGLGGYGQAHSSGTFRSEYLFSRSELNKFDTRYHKAFGELGISYRAESGWLTLGAAYRLNQVTFESLIHNGESLPLRGMLRSEPLIFMRIGNEEGLLRWMQFQLGMGVSWTHGYNAQQSGNQEYALRYLQEGRSSITAGIVLYPHRFKKQQ